MSGFSDTHRIELSSGRALEADVHQVHVRIYDGHPHKYAGGFVADLQGRRAHVSQLVGVGFWEAIAGHTAALAELLGVEAITAFMVPAHVRAARRALAGRIEITVLREVEIAGRRMCEIMLTRPSESGSGG